MSLFAMLYDTFADHEIKDSLYDQCIKEEEKKKKKKRKSNTRKRIMGSGDCNTAFCGDIDHLYKFGCAPWQTLDDENKVVERRVRFADEVEEEEDDWFVVDKPMVRTSVIKIPSPTSVVQNY